MGRTDTKIDKIAVGIFFVPLKIDVNAINAESGLHHHGHTCLLISQNG
jgi:hypothetical protein